MWQDEWMKWRSQGVCASEMPAILGQSDFMSPHDIYLIKTGQKEQPYSNPAMRRGQIFEPKIRALYEFEKNMDAPPRLCEHPDYRFMRCSLDGYIEEEDTVLEIKYPSKKKHEGAIRGEIPRTYSAQIQHQLLVTGAKRCDYVSFDGKDIVIVEVFPNQMQMAWILIVAEQFWDHVQKKEPWHGFKI